MKAAWLAILLAALHPSAVVCAAPQPGAEAAVNRWPPHYGNAPADLVPYRRVVPFLRFFTKPQPFLGPGRDYPPPPGLKSLKIGLMSPAPSSPDGPRGLMIRRAVQLAFDEANAARTPGSLPFQLIVREDKPSWGSAANIMLDFATKDHVLAVIGTVDGASTHVALRVALKVEVFIVNTADPDPTLTETAIPWILRVWPDDRQHGYRLAQIVVQQRHCRRIVVFRSNDRYGRVGVQIFTDSVRRLGVPIVEELRYTPGDRTFDSQVATIRAANADAVVFWGEPDEVGRAAAALRAGGVQAAFFGPGRLMNPAFLKAAGPAAEGTTVTYPFNPYKTDAAWTGFVKRFEKRYGMRPDAYAGYAYDGTQLLINAVRAQGPNRYRIRDALYALRDYDGVTGHMRFDPTLNNLAPLVVARVRHGVFVFEKDLQVAKR